MRSRPPDTDELLDLVGLFYASAVDPDKITHSLAALERCLDLSVSHIFTFDRATHHVLHSQVSNPDHAGHHDDYVNHWGHRDPRVPRVGRLSSGAVLRCDEVCDAKFVSGNDYYQDYLIPSGLRWGMAGVIDAGDGATTVLAGMRAPDLPAFDPDNAKLLARLLPHLQRAGMLRSKLARQAAGTYAPAGLVERLPMPSFVVDDRSRVVLSNDAFSAAVTGMPLRMAGSWLRFLEPRMQQDWLRHLRDVSEHRTAATLRWKSAEGQHARIHIVPWQTLSSHSDAIERRLALVMMDLVAAASDNAGVDAVATAAGLTPTEAKVLGLVAKGHSAKTIARMRGVTDNTVRNQITRILDKTSCHSQRELMARIAVFHADGLNKRGA